MSMKGSLADVSTRKVIGTVYADNDQDLRAIDDLEYLEIATSQAGVFYENELRRRRIAGQPKAGVPSSTPPTGLPPTSG